MREKTTIPPLFSLSRSSRCHASTIKLHYTHLHTSRGKASRFVSITPTPHDAGTRDGFHCCFCFPFVFIQLQEITHHLFFYIISFS